MFSQRTSANSVDPDQTALKEQSDRALHGLPGIPSIGQLIISNLTRKSVNYSHVFLWCPNSFTIYGNAEMFMTATVNNEIIICQMKFNYILIISNNMVLLTSIDYMFWTVHLWGRGLEKHFGFIVLLGQWG